jgi:hypothetical protein
MQRGYNGYTPQSVHETFSAYGDPAMHVGRYTIELPSVVGKHDGSQWGQQSDEKYRQGFQLAPYINRPLIKSRLMVEADVDRNCNPIAGTNSGVAARFIGSKGPLQPGYQPSAEDIRQELLGQAPQLDPTGAVVGPNLNYIASTDPSQYHRVLNNANALPTQYTKRGMPTQQIQSRVAQERNAVGLARGNNIGHSINQNTGTNAGRIQGNSYGVNLAGYDPHFVNFAHAQINYAPSYNGNRDPLSGRVHSFLSTHLAAYADLFRTRENHADTLNTHILRGNHPSRKALKQLAGYDTELNGYPSHEDMKYLHHHIHTNSPLYQQYLRVVDHLSPIFHVGKMHGALGDISSDLQHFHRLAFSMVLDKAKLREVEILQIYNPYISSAGA